MKIVLKIHFITKSGCSCVVLLGGLVEGLARAQADAALITSMNTRGVFDDERPAGVVMETSRVTFGEIKGRAPHLGSRENLTQAAYRTATPDRRLRDVRAIGRSAERAQPVGGSESPQPHFFG